MIDVQKWLDEKYPTKNEEINGKVLNKLIFFGGGIGEEKKIFYSVEKDYVSKLKEFAKKLGIKDEELVDKPVGEIEKLVSNKAGETKEGDEANKDIIKKIENVFPELISEGKVVEDKLKEIENKVKEGDELGKLGLKVEDVKKMQIEMENLRRLAK